MTRGMMARIARREVNRKLETKVGMQTSNDGTEIAHNNLLAGLDACARNLVLTSG